MSEQKHTPGPWEAHKPDGYFGYLIYAPDESIVAREVHPKANAALIAAAPETAAELERVRAENAQLASACARMRDLFIQDKGEYAVCRQDEAMMGIGDQMLVGNALQALEDAIAAERES